MSQHVVEGVLGRLITDVEFRQAFLAAPEDASRRYDLGLTAAEIEALARTDAISLDVLAGCLEPTIVRAAGGSVAAVAPGARARR